MEYEYKIGITIPYPSMFTNAIRAIIRRFLFFIMRVYYIKKNMGKDSTEL